MSTFPVTRLYDKTTHAGPIVTGSQNCFTNSRKRCRERDIHMCPIHGPNIILTGSPRYTANSRRVSRKTRSVCACGAVLAEGSPNHRCE